MLFRVNLDGIVPKWGLDSEVTSQSCLQDCGRSLRSRIRSQGENRHTPTWYRLFEAAIWLEVAVRGLLSALLAG